MKNSLFVPVFLLASSCSQLPIELPPDTQATSSTSTECPTKPGVDISLPSDKVKEITVNGQVVNESGQVNTTQSVGFSFDANAGQKLSYKTNDDLCIWTYNPKNDILDGTEITTDGKHTVQVAARQGSTTFDLEIGLNAPQASSPPPSNNPSSNNQANSSSPSESSNTSQRNTSPSSNLSTNPQRTSSSTSNINSRPSGLSQNQAVSIVKQWLAAKSKIFAPPYNRSLVNQLTTGKRNYDTTKSGGSIDWLQSRGMYYTYRASEVRNVWSFNSSSTRPQLKVSIHENYALHRSSGAIEKSNSYTENYVISFALDNGVWKISDIDSD